ncbi:MAG: endonuclease/exonuclease/phosphatase family metal-dependent hydrolase [Cyclobacteriaceae bacterium]|jgi:endonuclease/exonuclease/phosphatase family metal-dependent hydrolase
MLRKALFYTLIAAVPSFCVFYFWASSSNLDVSEKYVIKQYNEDQVSKTDTLRAITFNIGYLSGMTNNLATERKKELFDINLSASIKALGDLSPSIIGLQEVDYDAYRSFHLNQADTLAQTLQFTHGYHSVNWDKRYVPFPYGLPSYNFRKIVSGQSIIAEGAFFNAETFKLSDPSEAPFYYKAFYLDRLIQKVDWVVGEDTVTVLNLHLEAFDQQTRMMQAERLVSLYEFYYQKGPVLILGDFNSRQSELDNDAMRLLMRSPDIGSAISWEQYQQDSVSYFTYSSANPSYMIDYILYNKNFIVPIGSRVVQEIEEVSDHLPVLFDFMLAH